MVGKDEWAVLAFLVVVIVGLGLLLSVTTKRAWQDPKVDKPTVVAPDNSYDVPLPMPKPLEMWVKKTMRVTAYCPCVKCCGKHSDGITASGRPAVGKLVSAPPDIEFGLRVRIPGYGEAIVADRGGKITGDRLDVLFMTHAEALQWGVQELEVELEWIPPRPG